MKRKFNSIPLSEIDKIISDNVLRLMEEKNMTNKRLGEMLGISESMMSHRLKAQKKWYANTVYEIAQIFKVGVEELYEQR